MVMRLNKGRVGLLAFADGEARSPSEDVVASIELIQRLKRLILAPVSALSSGEL